MALLEAHAKINLGLDIIGRRQDGYHLLRMVMQTLALCDLVRVERLPGETGIRTSTESSLVPDDERNLAWRAAKLLTDTFSLSDGISVSIEKRIPVAAGLAGGSADAAAVLVGVSREFRLGLTEKELRELGLSLGADVPYCLTGGTLLSEGIGEILTPVLPPFPSCGVLLAKPPEGVSTAEVYRAYDSLEEKPEHPDIDGLAAAIRSGSLSSVCGRLGNVLEAVTIPRLPVIREIKDFLISAGAEGVLMSGSGPTVFGLFPDLRILKRASEGIRLRFPDLEISETGTWNPVS